MNPTLWPLQQALLQYEPHSILPLQNECHSTPPFYNMSPILKMKPLITLKDQYLPGKGTLEAFPCSTFSPTTPKTIDIKHQY